MNATALPQSATLPPPTVTTTSGSTSRACRAVSKHSQSGVNSALSLRTAATKPPNASSIRSTHGVCFFKEPLVSSSALLQPSPSSTDLRRWWEPGPQITWSGIAQRSRHSP